MTLAGTAGIGKTTIAKIIANSIENSVVMYINASDENGIDTVRTKITGFVEQFSLGIKIVILDEADGLTNDGQKCLRHVIESHLDDTRFILTCNYPEKLIAPIVSRCPIISLNFELVDVFKHALQLVKSHGYDFSADRASILELTKSCFPDIRKLVTKLEQSYATGVFQQHVDVMDTDVFVSEIINLAKTDIMAARQMWLNNQPKFGTDYVKLAGQVFNSVTDVKLLKRLGDKYIHLNMVVDKEIGFFCMMMEFQSQ